MIEIIQADITEERVHAIVNAANSHLVHGGGVAGQIVKKGGKVIQELSNEYVKKNGPVMTGASCHTKAGGKLECDYVIHTVGPVYNNYSPEDAAKLLQSAIINSFEEAHKIDKVESISIPAISSGIFGFPKDKCALIMLETSIKWAFHT